MVVGAGFGGIAAGVKLKRAGIDTFTIYESSLGIGGTWWDNTYPGAEVDVGSHLYCFSFKPHDWTRTHARQPELQKYLEETVDEFGLRPHLAARRHGRVGDVGRRPSRLDGRARRRQRRRVPRARQRGRLPQRARATPTGPGSTTSTGPKFHTARWEHEHDLTGKVVAVVGTGSSATQVVPAIQPIVEQLYVFQREPGWVMPKGERDFTDEERAAVRQPVAASAGALAASGCSRRALWRGILPARHQGATRRARSSASTTSTASSPTGPTCGRPSRPRTRIRASGRSSPARSIPRSKEPNVELVPRAVASVTPDGIVDVDGVERAVDVIVMATGFQPAELPRPPAVVGRDGRTLQEHWAGEPHAFLGITVPGFPNFFMLYGPGTNGGEIVTMLESQAEYAVRADEAHDPRARHRGRGEDRASRRGGTAGCSPRWTARRGR